MAKPPADLPADGVVATFAYLGFRAGAAARARKGRGDLGDCVIDRHDVDDYEERDRVLKR